MPATPNEHEIAGETESYVVSALSVERSNPASLVFIACAECTAVLSLAESVRSFTGAPVCWDCGLLSLRGSRP